MNILLKKLLFLSLMATFAMNGALGCRGDGAIDLEGGAQSTGDNTDDTDQSVGDLPDTSGLSGSEAFLGPVGNVFGDFEGGDGTFDCGTEGTVTIAGNTASYNNCLGLSGEVTISDNGESVVTDGSLSDSLSGCTFSYNAFSVGFDGSNLLLDGSVTYNCQGASVTCNYNGLTVTPDQTGAQAMAGACQ